MTSDRRQRAYRRGRRGEWLAALYLMAKGYRILERNYRCGAGEIDLVARRGRTLVFVEVKVRGSVEAAVEAVGGRARRRIAAAARVWLALQTGYDAFTWRFDILALRPRRLPVHLVSAFDGD